MALTKVKGHIIADDLALGGNPTTSTQSASDNSTKIATTAYVTTAVSNLVDGAPSTLNTLNEIAAALNDDAALNTTLTNAIAAKLPLAGGSLTGNLLMRNGGNIELGGYNSGNDKGLILTPQDGSGYWHVYNTAGGHLAFGASSTIGSSEKMRIDGSGNVVINKANFSSLPTGSKLNIFGDGVTLRLDGSSGTTKSILFRGTNVANPGEVYADGSLRFRTEDASTRITFHTNSSGSNNERMRIDSSGAVGIKKIPPSGSHTSWSQLFIGEKGSVISENANSGGFYGTWLTDNMYIAQNTGAFKNITTDESSAYRQEGGVHQWFTHASGSADAAITLSEKMRIDSSGDVRIGTTGQMGNATLTIKAYTSTNTGLMLQEYDTSNAYGLYTVTSDDSFRITRFASGGYNDRLTIDSSGNVGINCTAPEEKLVVDGGFKIANTNNRLYFGTEGGTSIRALEGNSSGSVLQVGEGYTNVLLGSASAKVGIRQTSPDSIIHVGKCDNSIAGLTLEGDGNGDIIHMNFKAKANNGTLSYHGLSASPGADQDDNTISLGNGAGNGVVVNHQNVVRTRYSEIHSGGTFAYDVGGNYLGANGAGFGTHAIFRTPSVSSPSNGAASTQFLTVYSSGHWGEYPVCRFRLYTTYFNGGYREYLFRQAAGTSYLNEVPTHYTNGTSWGAAPGSITKGSTTSTGQSHSGQTVYRTALTFTSTSAYYRNYVVTEIMFGANRYYSSANTQAQIDALYNLGGKYHFKTISLAEGRGKFAS